MTRGTAPAPQSWLVTSQVFVGFFIALIIPNRLSWITPDAFAYLPLEFIAVCLLLLVPNTAGKVLRLVLAALLAIGVLCKVADLLAYQVFSRPFNPVFDAYLLSDGMRLLTGVIGKVGALVVAVLLALLLVLILWLAAATLRRVQRVLQPHRKSATVMFAALLCAWLGLKLSDWPRANHYFYDELALHLQATIGSVVDLRQFNATVNDDAYAQVPSTALFDKLRGKDVYVIFVESYGRVVLDDPAFADATRENIEQANAQLAFNGVQVRSAYLKSPTVGGISWLAHGTALSGLWIDSQVRYDSLMLSERPSLNKLFKRAGWRTVAAMPAISMAWPEGDYFGYDTVYDAHNSGYAGLPFNWVTMPDQYVLAMLQARERSNETNSEQRAPVMAEIALISSHAPWTPTPTLVPWGDVGDGRIFNAQAQAGPTPEEVWQDPMRIREQFRSSLDYAINNLASYAINFGDDNLVMIILGDHQPAPLVAGELANNDVPVHIIARDPAVMEALADWRWTPSLLPAQDAPVWRMDELRDRLVEAFSTSAFSMSVKPEAKP
jgi:hypothetical protein